MLLITISWNSVLILLKEYNPYILAINDYGFYNRYNEYRGDIFNNEFRSSLEIVLIIIFSSQVW